MSSTKHLADLVKVCSILPALLVVPAVADLPNTDGNAWVFGDLNLNYDTANKSAIGGRYVDVAGNKVNDFPNYNMVGRSVNLTGTEGKRPSVYVGPVNMTLRELQANENFVYNWQNADGAESSNWNDAAMAGEESSMTDFDLAKLYGIKWGDSIETIFAKTNWGAGNAGLVGGLSLFANRDATKIAGALATNNVDLTVDGAKIIAEKVSLANSVVNIVKQAVPADFPEEYRNIASDGVTKFSVGEFVAKDNSRFVVGSGAELDLTESGNVQFVNNVITGNNDGAAINVAANGSLKIDGAKFANNDSHDGGGFGGAIWNKGKADIKNATFEKNVATSGGAIGGSKDATGVLSVDGASFVENTALDDGGAIVAFKSLEIKNSVFENNSAMYSKDENGASVVTEIADPIGGGALALGARSETEIATISGTVFKNNKSGYNGGAIATRLADRVAVDGTLTGGKNSNSAKLDIAATFIGNVAEKDGGAIYNSFYNDNGAGKGQGVTVTGVFEENKAGGYGGAIFNDGRQDLNGKGGVMTINTAVFEENQADLANGYGGAVFNYLGKVNILGTEDSNVVFEDNIAYVGGAFSDRQVSSSFPGMKSETVIKYALFEDNHAVADAGAAGLYGDAELQNVIFRENTAGVDFDGVVADVANSDGGGAVQLGGTSNVTMKDVYFAENESGVRGGAISARHGKNYTLDIDTATFASNKSGNFGGAIANIYAGTVDMNTVDFVSNSAKKAGGAIYNGVDKNYGAPGGVMSTNHGVLVFDGVNNFIGNSAGEYGGAIFNDEGGTINMAGVNTFAGNTAKDAANDIYNLGYLNIVSGTTSVDGGIRGTGSLVLGQGATLDIANTTIQQGTIDLDGTVKASLVNNQRGNGYGRFVGDVTIGENALFELNVGATGTYDIWNGALVDASQIKVGIAYEVASVDTNGVTIVTKAADALAVEAGISTQAAGTVAGLANSSSGKAHQVSLVLQDALNNGETEFVEAETKKLNPDDKPVVQAAAVSIQNQVLSLTAGRMAGGMSIGRAGGDASQENAFWIQGLFNKSKFADKFHGYTRGVAMGADTLIGRVWTIGGGLAFNSSDVHSSARHTDIDSKTLFAYAQYKPNKWFLNATATYNMSEYTENIAAAGGVSVANTFDVDSYGAQIMTGYDFATGITTELGARYLHVAQDGYTDELGLVQVDALDTDFLTGVAGLRYAFNIENDWSVRLRPELRAAMTYDVISDDKMATVVMPGVASYTVDGDRLSRMGGEFGIGLTALYNGIELSVMYDLDLHRDYTSQTGMIKFRAKF